MAVYAAQSDGDRTPIKLAGGLPCIPTHTELSEKFVGIQHGTDNIGGLNILLDSKADKYNFYLSAIAVGGPMENLTLDLDVVLADPTHDNFRIASSDQNFVVLRDWTSGQLNLTYTHNGIVDYLITNGVIVGSHDLLITDVWSATDVEGIPTPNAWYVVYGVKEVVDLQGQWVNLRGPADSLVDAVSQRVRFKDTKEKAALYLNSRAVDQPTADLTENHSIFYKYTTLADLQGSDRWGDNVVVKISAGSDTSNEGLVLHNMNAVALYSESAPDVASVLLGSVLLSGTTDNITLSGVSLTDTFTLGSNGKKVVAQNTNFLGEIVAAASGLITTWDLIRSFEKCRFERDIILNGTATVEYGLYDCWAYANENGVYPTLTLNNPNATLILDGTTALKMNINVIQCKDFIMNGVSINSLITAGPTKVTLKSGSVCNPDDEQEPRPITINSTGKTQIGISNFDLEESILGSAFDVSGIASLQVIDTAVRQGITPRIDPTDGTNRVPGEDPPNLVRDWINGIADAIVALQGGQAGIADGGISDDETKINFYPDTIHKGDQYALFQLPLSLFGIYTGDENSIHLNQDGSFSVILNSGPLFEALQTKVTAQVGMGLSSNDYSNTDKAKLGSLATINAVTIANGLSLDAGTLSLADLWSTPIAAKQDKLTATGTTNLLVAPSAQGGQPGTKPISDFQASLTATGTTNFLTAPSSGGGQPGTKAVSDLLSSPAAQTADTQILLAPATKGSAPTLLPVAPIVQRKPITGLNSATYTIDSVAHRTIQFTTMGSGSGRRFIRLYKVNTDGYNKARMKVTSRYIWSTEDFVWSQAAANTAPVLQQGSMQWDTAVISRFFLFLGNDGYMWIDYETTDLGGMKLILDLSADDPSMAEVLFTSNVPTAVGASVDMRLAVIRKTYVTNNGLTISYQRKGNIVYAQCSGGQITAGVAAYATMGTIPVGYRPSIQTPQQDSIYATGIVNPSSANLPVGFQIYTGLIRPMQALSAASYVIFGWSWITDEQWPM